MEEPDYYGQCLRNNTYGTRKMPLVSDRQAECMYKCTYAPLYMHRVQGLSKTLYTYMNVLFKEALDETTEEVVMAPRERTVEVRETMKKMMYQRSHMLDKNNIPRETGGGEGNRHEKALQLYIREEGEYKYRTGGQVTSSKIH
jgi:hypothetical protein